MARSIIVTGGFGILGSAVARAFAAAGDKVARVDLAPAARDAIEGGLDIGGIDLTDAAATGSAMEQAAAAHGGIDVLVNIAGGFTWETFSDGALDSWLRMQQMNLVSAATATRQALAHLRVSGSGRVINIGAAAALKSGTGMGAYAASKSGVHRLTESLADEFAGTGLTVNAILPTIIDTPTNRADMPDADFSKWTKPEAIADAIVLLASPAARAITGALIPVV